MAGLDKMETIREKDISAGPKILMVHADLVTSLLINVIYV